MVWILGSPKLNGWLQYTFGIWLASPPLSPGHAGIKLSVSGHAVCKPKLPYVSKRLKDERTLRARRFSNCPLAFAFFFSTESWAWRSICLIKRLSDFFTGLRQYPPLTQIPAAEATAQLPSLDPNVTGALRQCQNGFAPCLVYQTHNRSELCHFTLSGVVKVLAIRPIGPICTDTIVSLYQSTRVSYAFSNSILLLQEVQEA